MRSRSTLSALLTPQHIFTASTYIMLQFSMLLARLNKFSRQATAKASLFAAHTVVYAVRIVNAAPLATTARSPCLAMWALQSRLDCRLSVVASRSAQSYLEEKPSSVNLGHARDNRKHD